MDDVPVAPGTRFTKADCIERVQGDREHRWFRSVTMSLNHAQNWTRPDLTYLVTKTAKFMQSPGGTHIKILKRGLRYLRGALNLGLTFDFRQPPRRKGLYGFFDASHADDLDTRRSTIAYAFFFSGCALSWKSKLHSFVTTSTNHSELVAAAMAAREAKFLWKLFGSLGTMVRASLVIRTPLTFFLTRWGLSHYRAIQFFLPPRSMLRSRISLSVRWLRVVLSLWRTYPRPTWLRTSLQNPWQESNSLVSSQSSSEWEVISFHLEELRTGTSLRGDQAVLVNSCPRPSLQSTPTTEQALRILQSTPTTEQALRILQSTPTTEQALRKLGGSRVIPRQVDDLRRKHYLGSRLSTPWREQRARDHGQLSLKLFLLAHFVSTTVHIYHFFLLTH